MTREALRLAWRAFRLTMSYYAQNPTEAAGQCDVALFRWTRPGEAAVTRFVPSVSPPRGGETLTTDVATPIP